MRMARKLASKPVAQPLAQAVRTVEMSWGNRRGARTDGSQMRKALDTLLTVLGPNSAAVTPGDVDADTVLACADKWLLEGLAANTVNKRLCMLSSLGINTSGAWERGGKQLKWWLHPDKCEALLEYLRTKPAPFRQAELTADYVEWASLVGMRVEESLRLRWSDVNIQFSATDTAVVSLSEVTVPGTKTAGAQASLALALRPALLLQRRLDARLPGDETKYVFPISYDALHECWQQCRAYLGVSEIPGATLKALRRTAARHLTVRGMPLDVVRQYLRHSSINTTMGYLRLVGGYTTEEQRKWL